MTTAYPLHWPAGLPRTKTKLQSRFQSTLHRALDPSWHFFPLTVPDRGMFAA